MPAQLLWNLRIECARLAVGSDRLLNSEKEEDCSWSPAIDGGSLPRAANDYADRPISKFSKNTEAQIAFDALKPNNSQVQAPQSQSATNSTAEVQPMKRKHSLPKAPRLTLFQRLLQQEMKASPQETALFWKLCAPSPCRLH
ncbi:MAG: hypothetical protein ABIQ90_01485 [Polaromonas sp.]